eukprot:1724220-Heterocapsa_arctica.AAC.1
MTWAKTRRARETFASPWGRDGVCGNRSSARTSCNGVEWTKAPEPVAMLLPGGEPPLPAGLGDGYASALGHDVSVDA